MFKKSDKAQKPTKPKNVTPRQASHDFVQASLQFEKSRITDIEKSKKVAWYVAGGACICALASTLAVVALTPLKTVEPYVIRVDNNTGQTDIVTVLDTKTMSKSEAMDRFFASQYVQLLEGYDWYTIQNQVDKVMLFSSDSVQAQVRNKFSYPTAPHKTLKEFGRINIKVTNTTVLDTGLIQVRYTATTEPVSGQTWDKQSKTLRGGTAKNYIATIGFDYVNVPSVDEIRRINPLGFTVRTYKVDEDNSVATPNTTKTPEVQAVQPQQAPVVSIIETASVTASTAMPTQTPTATNNNVVAQ